MIPLRTYKVKSRAQCVSSAWQRDLSFFCTLKLQNVYFNILLVVFVYYSYDLKFSFL